MAFIKGQSGNPEGRPKGAKDKATKEIREKISDILDEHFTPAKVTENLEAMDPKDRLLFLTKLMEYAVPKLKQTDLKADVFDHKTEVPVIVFKDFSKTNQEHEANK